MAKCTYRHGVLLLQPREEQAPISGGAKKELYAAPLTPFDRGWRTDLRHGSLVNFRAEPGWMEND